jgi:hypothetical protein
MDLTAARSESSAAWMWALRFKEVILSRVVVFESSLYNLTNCWKRFLGVEEVAGRGAYLDENDISASFCEGDGHCGADASGSTRDKGGFARKGEEGGD